MRKTLPTEARTTATAGPRLLTSTGPAGSPPLSVISFDGDRFVVTASSVTTTVAVPDVVDHLLTPLDTAGVPPALVVLAEDGDDARVAIAVHRGAASGWIDARTGTPLTDDDLRAEVLSLFTTLMSCGHTGISGASLDGGSALHDGAPTKVAS